jgi:membrane fusion protein
MANLNDRKALFRDEVLNKKHRDTFGSVLLKQPKEYIYFAVLMFALVVLALCLIAAGTYTRYAEVFGMITVDKGIVKITARAEGEIVQQFQSKSQKVKKGELLYIISTARHSSEKSNLDQSILEQQVALQRSMERDIQVAKKAFEIEQQSLLESVAAKKLELEQLLEQMNIYIARVSISEANLNRNKSLFTSKHINQVQFDKVMEDHLVLLTKQGELITRHSKVGASSKELTFTYSLKPQEFSEKINRLERNLLENKQRISELSSNIDYRIFSPVDGVIGTRLSHTGSYVQRGTSLLTIIPKDSLLQAELYVPAQSIGFIQKGQIVSMRYSAFPYQQFGLQDGRVKSVSKVISLPDEIATSVSLSGAVYKVIVDLSSQYVHAKGQERSIQVGMELDASIALEHRTLFEWILAPVYSLKDK